MKEIFNPGRWLVDFQASREEALGFLEQIKAYYADETPLNYDDVMFDNWDDDETLKEEC